MPTTKAYPYVDKDTSNLEYKQLFQLMQDSGIVFWGGDTAPFRVTANSTGMRVSVSAGAGGQPARALLCGFMFWMDGATTLTIEGSSPSLDRIDAVVLDLTVSNPADQLVVLKVLKGVPALNPQPPALQQSTEASTYQLPLALVRVPRGAVTIAAGNVSDARRGIGSQVSEWSTGRMPTNVKPFQIGFNSSTAEYEYWFEGRTYPLGGALGLSAVGLSSVPLPVSLGGTGATDAAGARSKLDAAATVHTHTAAQTTSGQFEMARMPMRWQCQRRGITTDANGLCVQQFYTPVFFPNWVVQLSYGNGEHVVKGSFPQLEAVNWKGGVTEIILSMRDAVTKALLPNYAAVVQFMGDE